MKHETKFTFAGFAWPRDVADMACGHAALLKKREQRKYVGGYYHAPKPGADGRGFCLERTNACGLRWDWCDEVNSRIEHDGWYIDEFQDTTIRGIVARLPRSRGFLAGWSMGVGMASGLSYTIYEDIENAARAADDKAKTVAEREREYQENEREKSDLSEAIDDAESDLDTALDDLRGLLPDRANKTVRKLIRRGIADVRELRATIEAKTRELEALS